MVLQLPPVQHQALSHCVVGAVCKPALLDKKELLLFPQLPIRSLNNVPFSLDPKGCFENSCTAHGATSSARERSASHREK